MEVALAGMVCLGGIGYLKWKPTRAVIWNYIAAWAAANRDAAITRDKSMKKYTTAEVPNE